MDPIGCILSNKLLSNRSLQNRAERIIMGYPNEYGQSNAAMAELGWKTLRPERRLQSKARLMYKITYGLTP